MEVSTEWCPRKPEQGLPRRYVVRHRRWRQGSDSDHNQRWREMGETGQRHGERSLGVLVLTRRHGCSRTRRDSDAIFIDPEQLPVALPPVVEIVEEPEIPEEEVTVEEVTYHWDIIRRATWQTDFSDTYFLDEHTGWTVGGGGVIAHTTDSGKTWLPQHSSVEADLYQVMFVDKLHGWITGNRMLLRTEDGGKHGR